MPLFLNVALQSNHPISKMQTRRGPIKELSRRARLAWYHYRNGAGYDYHGIKVDIPDEVMFTFKRQVMRGDYEEPERRLVDRFLDPSIPVLELGGSLGILSAYVGSKLDPETPCRIVEANPSIVDICARNANRTRPGTQAEVVNAAIAYDARSVPFAASPNVHISKVSQNRDARTIDVRATTLSDQVQAFVGEGPYSLIMDIEGMEFDVFEREPQAFANCRLAIVEFHPHLFDQRGQTVDTFFALSERAGLQTIAVDGNSAAFAPVG